MFTPDELHKVINEHLDLNAAPAHTHAVLVVATTNGIKGIFTRKVGNVWELSSELEVDHAAHVQGGVTLKASW